LERATPIRPRPDVFRVVAVGFDWIEYTAKLDVRADVARRLQELQDASKRGDPRPVYLGTEKTSPWASQGVLGVPFVALPKSTRFYKWGLENEELGITLWFTDSDKRPGVKVEIRSHALWHFGQHQAYEFSRRAVAECLGHGAAFDCRPARIDFTVDFQGVTFDPSNAADVVSRAKKRDTGTVAQALCVKCYAELLPEHRRCGRCGANRSHVWEGMHVVGGVTTPGARPADKDELERRRRLRQLRLSDRAAGKLEKVWTVISAERCPIKPAHVAAGVTHRMQYGGYGGRKFTGWVYGSGESNRVNVYLKTEEIRTQSPDKVWFYDVWAKAPGYVYSRCPDCGTTSHTPKIVPANAPLEGTEMPPESGKKSGLARVVMPGCDTCMRPHVVEPVWRCEVRSRGNVLTKFAPDGVNKISTVDEVFKHADEIWLFLVGQPYRMCHRCQSVPIGNEQRRRACRPCVAARERELKRPLTNDEAIEWAPLTRRRGWFEARDSSASPSDRPTRWPVAPWWQHLQWIHFDGSAPPTATSRKLRDLASADLNRTMARGCALSVVDSDGLYDKWLAEHDGVPPTPDEFKQVVIDALFGDVDGTWLAERLAEKRARRGLGRPHLETGPTPPPPSSPPPPATTQLSGAPAPERVYREVEFELGEPGGAPDGSDRDGKATGEEIPF
jgi:uncharacterized OB-fold protein